MDDAEDLYPEDDEILNEDIKKPPIEKTLLAKACGESSLYPLRDDISADLTCEFLEVALQQILYHRGIYPKEIFSCCKKYHVGVHISTYLELTEYLVNIIKQLKPYINKKKVKQVVLSILENGKVFENFVFELSEARTWKQKRDEELLQDLEISLRECLLKIATYDAPVPEDPTKCTFEILAHVDRSSAMELLFEDESPVRWITEDEDCNSNVTKLHPLKSIKNSPFMKMQLFVLEN